MSTQISNRCILHGVVFGCAMMLGAVPALAQMEPRDVSVDEAARLIAGQSTAQTTQAAPVPDYGVNPPPSNPVSAAGGIPSGAVLAFDRPDGSCPPGWSSFDMATGRVIVGMGSGSDGQAYAARQQGGAAMQALTVDNMPNGPLLFSGPSVRLKENLTPPYVHIADRSLPDRCLDGEVCTRYPVADYTVEMKGKAAPLDNRPPFVALKYCRKN